MIIDQCNNKISFEELKTGDVFRCNNAFYIKTDCYATDSNFEFNSYDLSGNDICYFSNSDKVERMKAKLVIE